MMNCLTVKEKLKKFEVHDINGKDEINQRCLLQFTVRDELYKVDGKSKDVTSVGQEKGNSNNKEIHNGVDLIKLEQMFCDYSKHVDDYLTENESFIEYNDDKVNNARQFTPKNTLVCDEDNMKFSDIKVEEIFCESENTEEEVLIEVKEEACLLDAEIEVKIDDHDLNGLEQYDGKFKSEEHFTPKNISHEEDGNKFGAIKVEETFCGENPVEIEDKTCSLNEEIKTKTEEHDFPRSDDGADLSESKFTYMLGSRRKLKSDREMELSKPYIKHTLTNEKSSKSRRFHCERCSFQSKYQRSLVSHMQMHKDPLEVTVYKCDFCPLQTKYKGSLASHLLMHKDPSEVTMYTCDSCSYRAKRKGDLKSHSVLHKDPSEVTMYKCNSCLFQTKHKQCITSHLLQHEKPSNITMFKCDSCPFETKFKRCLKGHLKLHKDPSDVKTYKCDSCSFQTIHKSYLKSHSLKHKDPLEVAFYECDICLFQSKYKKNLKTHMLKHKDPSEVTMYKCDSCSYETKTKSILNRHLKLHMNPSEVEMYECDRCLYRTIHKPYLKVHMLTHKKK